MARLGKKSVMELTYGCERKDSLDERKKGKMKGKEAKSVNKRNSLTTAMGIST